MIGDFSMGGPGHGCGEVGIVWVDVLHLESWGTIIGFKLEAWTSRAFAVVGEEAVVAGNE